MRLRDYQAAAVEQIAPPRGPGRFAHAQGAGKTHTAHPSAPRRR